jgi:hypothetical protein
MDRLTTATVTTPLGVLSLCVHVVVRIGQAVRGMALPWRTHQRGLELRWWCLLRPCCCGHQVSTTGCSRGRPRYRPSKTSQSVCRRIMIYMNVSHRRSASHLCPRFLLPAYESCQRPSRALPVQTA